jgi:hypothetical protein
MFLNSVSGLHKAVQGTDYYQTKRPTAKDVLIDRCNFVVNAIVQGNRHNWSVKDFELVPLHRDVLRSQLDSRESYNIINLLKDLEYITVNNSYISQAAAAAINTKRVAAGLSPSVVAESKKYGLTDKSKGSGIIKVGVLSEKSIKRLKRYKSKMLLFYLKDKEIHSKIFNNITDLQFNSEGAKDIHKEYTSNNPNKNQSEFYDNSYKTLKEINSYVTDNDYINCSEFYYTQSKKVNRVYHYYSNIPSSYRKHLLHDDGSQLAEIDLKNSQPFIIVMNYIEGLKNKEINQFKSFARPQESTYGVKTDLDRINKKRERKEIGSICGVKSLINRNTSNLLNEVLSGSLYKTIAEYALSIGDDEFYNLYINQYGKFKAKILGEGLYFNYLPLAKIKPAERYLIDLFPEFMKWVRESKRTNGYKSISIQAQQIESSFFIDGLFASLKENDFAVPIHDSIIVKAQEVEYFKNKLIAIFEDRYTMLTRDQVSNLFKIENYAK